MNNIIIIREGVCIFYRQSIVIPKTAEYIYSANVTCNTFFSFSLSENKNFCWSKSSPAAIIIIVININMVVIIVIKSTKIKNGMLIKSQNFQALPIYLRCFLQSKFIFHVCSKKEYLPTKKISTFVAVVQDCTGCYIVFNVSQSKM